MSKRIAIIGIGMDGNTTLTWEAEAVISVAELLIGADRMLAPFKDSEKEMICCYQSEEIAKKIADSEAESIAVLMSGDCGFYSGAKKLLPLLKEYEVQVISGISSPVYLASRLGISWQDMYFVSLHGRNANIARAVASHEKTFFLLGGKSGSSPAVPFGEPPVATSAEVCERLCAYGLADVEVTVGEKLAMEEERILQGRASEFTEVETDSLSVMLVVNPGYERYIASGISEEAFVRGQVPMTKSEVRAVCISKLRIGSTDVCYDLGCGTGSVSVEMALQCPEGTVYAVDKKTEAVALTRENAHRFACDNIAVVEGELTDVVGDLPAPDVVFIGGTSGTLSEVVRLVYEKNPSARVVMTAVSLETIGESLAVFETYGKTTEITQVAVTKTKKVAAHTMLAAENPVFIIMVC